MPENNDTKLIIISDNVRDVDSFIDKLLPDVKYIKVGFKDSINVFKEKLLGITLTNITNIGIVFDNTGDKAPFITYTINELQEEIDLQLEYQYKLNEYYDNTDTDNLNTIHPISSDFEVNPLFFFSPDLFFSNDFLNQLLEIKENSKLTTIDIISCNIKNNDQFLTLLNSHNITVRYSTTIIGKGSNWILESHNTDISTIYFDNSIIEYPYRLGAVEPDTQDINGNWIIDNADKLYWLMTRTNNDGSSLPDLSSSFIITEDIDMGDVTGGSVTYPTRSIGNKTNTSLSATCRFIGKILGNNKEVIIRDIDNNFFSGFIGNFGNFGPSPTFTPIPATIDNLTVKYTTDISFIASNIEASSTSLFSGLLIGIARAGIINNCKVSFVDLSPKVISITNIPTVGSLSGNFCELGLLIGRSQTGIDITNCIVEHSNNITIQVIPRVGCTIGGFCGFYLDSNLLSDNILNIEGDFKILINNNNTISNELNIIGGFCGQIRRQGIQGIQPVTILNNVVNSINFIINCISGSGRETRDINYIIGGFSGTILANTSPYEINSCSIITQNTFDLSITDISGTDSIGILGSHFFFIGGFAGNIQGFRSIININNVLCKNKRCVIRSEFTERPNFNYLNTIGGLFGRTLDNVILNNNTLISNEIVIGSINPNIRDGIGVSFFGFGIGRCTGAIDGVLINSLIITLNRAYLLSAMVNSSISFGCLVGTLFNRTSVENSTVTINELTSDGIIPLLLINNTIETFDILTSRDINYGGLFGEVTSEGTIIGNTNTANIAKLSLTAKSSSNVRIGGIVGLFVGTSSLINSTLNIGTNCNLISLQNNTSALIGGLVGLYESTGLIENNKIRYGDKLTFKANEDAETLFVNSLVGSGILNGENNNIIFVNYPLIFNSIENGTGINFEGIDYLIQPQTITITTNPFFLIDLSDITVFVYLRPPIPVNIGVPPCCIANICDDNPQTANYSNQNIVQNASGAQLVSAVSQFYQAAATGQLRPNAPPIFKTYGQMMDWKQRQHRR